YVTYLHNVFTGNFGTSMSFYPASVRSVIGGAIWWTGGLVGVGTVLAFGLGTGLGIVSAWRRGGPLDSGVPPVFVIASAVPYFWVAMVLVLIFGISLHWLPYIGGYNGSSDAPSLSPSYFGDVLSHALLPAAALLITTIGTWILTMRNAMITTLAEDYVRMARAKGLTGRRIMLDYAARNAILPNLTGFAMSLGFVVSGAILIEYVFNYPGVGYMLLQAVSGEDYPLMQALFLLITVAVLVAILIADIATALLDPRTRTAGERHVHAHFRGLHHTKPSRPGRARTGNGRTGRASCAAGHACARPDGPRGAVQPQGDVVRRPAGALHPGRALPRPDRPRQPERRRLCPAPGHLDRPPARHHRLRAGHVRPGDMGNQECADHRVRGRAGHHRDSGPGRRGRRLPRWPLGWLP